ALHWYHSLPEVSIGSFADWLSALSWWGEEDLEFLLQQTEGQSGVLGFLHHILTEVSQEISEREEVAPWEEDEVAESLGELDDLYAGCICEGELWAAVAALLEGMPEDRAN